MGYSFLQLAKDVLEFEGIPLTVEEMWKSAERNQLLEQLGSSGKTPIRTLSAQIYINLKKGLNIKTDVEAKKTSPYRA